MMTTTIMKSTNIMKITTKMTWSLVGQWMF